MPTHLIADDAGLFSCEIEVAGTVLNQALELNGAEEMLHSGLTVVLAALAHGPPWPERVLDTLAGLMAAMRDDILAARIS